MSEIVLIPRLNRNSKFVQLQEGKWLTPLNEKGVIEYCRVRGGILVHGNPVEADEKQVRKMKKKFPPRTNYVPNPLIAKEVLPNLLKSVQPGRDCDRFRYTEAREAFFRILAAEENREMLGRLIELAEQEDFLDHLSYVQNIAVLDDAGSMADAFVKIEEEPSVWICKTTVMKEYGFSEKLISQFLPEPVERINNYYHTAPSVKLFRKFDVERIYHSEEFSEERIRIEQRREKREKRGKEKQEREAAEKEARLTRMKTEFPDVNPVSLYPKARKMDRHFIVHIGPANSGKTHDALERFLEAETGIYLCPLRLLASEVYDLARSRDIPCSMLTGQEQFEEPGAKHMASTVELIDLETCYEVAVVDECQFLDDRQRGGAWTSAILGLQAAEIHLCAAPQALGVIEHLISLCGDSMEVIHHKRFNPLVPDPDPLYSLQKVKAGDCLVTFSRREVLLVAEELERMGFSVSRLYGSLPYSVKKAQADLFARNKTSLIVATDCIGLGMNLPIRRIVFLETEKFDGSRKRELTGEEYRQIAGRAGRYGMQEEGRFTVLKGDINRISILIDQPASPISQVRINLPPMIHQIPDLFSEKLRYWQDEYEPEGFLKQDVRERLQKALFLEDLTDDYQKVVSLSSVIFKPNHDVQNAFYEAGVRQILKEGTYNHIHFDENRLCSDYDLERACALLEIQYQFERILHMKKNRKKTMANRRRIEEELNTRMISRRKK